MHRRPSSAHTSHLHLAQNAQAKRPNQIHEEAPRSRLSQINHADSRDHLFTLHE